MTDASFTPRTSDGVPVPPQMRGVALKKLNGLLSEGWELDGFGIRRPSGDTMRYGLVTHGGAVLWWHGPTQKAAQELLEALKQFVSDFEGCYADGEPAMIKARAAIAKAEGIIAG